MGDWISSIFGGLLSFGQQMLQNDFNRKEAQKNRDFQSEEAELNRVFQSNEAALQRDWSAAEAERARDWNEEMYAKYNSLSGKIAQAEQAGVNPLFAVTGNSVSPMSTTAAAPSGASAGSVGTPGGATAASSFVDIVGSMLGMGKLKAEIDNIKADTKKKDAEGEGQLITNQSLRDMNVQQILESRSRIEFNEENTKLITQKIVESQANVDVMSAELGQISASIASMNADISVKQKQLEVMSAEIKRMSVQNLVDNEQVNVLRSQVNVLGAEFTKLVNENDFFAKVSQYRENILKASSDNSSLREKLSALSPLMSLPYDADVYEKNKIYRQRYEKAIENYVGVLKGIADSI